MATSTIKNMGTISGTPRIEASSKVTVAVVTFSYNQTGVASLKVLFHVNQATTNNETLFTVLNIKTPMQSLVVPCISSSDSTKYGNVNFSTGAVATSSGILQVAEWYCFYATYLF